MAGSVRASGPMLVRPTGLAYEPLGIADAVRAELAPAIGPGESATLGCGFALFEDCTFPWRLSYDECVYILEGRMELEMGDATLTAEAGDVVFLPEGSDVRYRFQGPCRLFYSTYPADWARTREASDA